MAAAGRAPGGSRDRGVVETLASWRPLFEAATTFLPLPQPSGVAVTGAGIISGAVNRCGGVLAAYRNEIYKPELQK